MKSSSSNTSATPCSFFAKGKCSKGAACTFYHAPREDFAKSPLPCKFYLQNTCRAGRECKFSHITGDEAQAAMKVSASTGEKSLAPGALRVPCKFFKHSECSVGDKCPYLHVKTPPSISSNGSQTAQRTKPKSTPAPSSAVTMHTLTRTPKASATSDEHEDKATAAAVATVSDSADEQLSDFLTKEEELYYYGAPGEFAEIDSAASRAAVQSTTGPTYSDVTKKNIPVALDDFYVDNFDEPIARPKTCTFFLQGNCRYGDACFYMHSLHEDNETADDMIAIGRELEASADLECNICLDAIVAKHERFGLLSGCNHAFCLPCVRNWRGTGDQPKQTVRQCPVCRVETNFVIPSSRMVTDPIRKAALIETYRLNLAAIPCRHFDEGRSACPFGSSCFYAHKYPDGSLDSRRVRTAVDADGHYDVLRQVRLEHFFSEGV